MAKGILRLFGFLTMIAGAIVFAMAFENRGRDTAMGMLTLLPISSALLIAGSILLGFAQALGLLERIERNTTPKAEAPGQWLQKSTETATR